MTKDSGMVVALVEVVGAPKLPLIVNGAVPRRSHVSEIAVVQSRFGAVGRPGGAWRSKHRDPTHDDRADNREGNPAPKPLVTNHVVVFRRLGAMEIAESQRVCWSRR